MLGLPRPANGSALGYIAQISDQVRIDLASHTESGPFGELASLALRRTLSETIGVHGRSLFGSSVDDIQHAFYAHSSPTRFGELARWFFGDYLSRTLRFLIEKELSNHVGAGHALTGIDASSAFATALDLHARAIGPDRGKFRRRVVWQAQLGIGRYDQRRGGARLRRDCAPQAPHGACADRPMTETRVLVVCDGVEPPQSLRNQKWSHQIPVTSLGTSADLNLRVQNLGGTVLGTIDNRAADLVRIASYVYAADQAVSRGGRADVFGQQWRRNFTLCIPVSDRAYWEQDQVRSALATVLLFVTEDTWELHFAEAVPSLRQLQLDVDDRLILDTPDAVVLFSGGADSLCTAVEAVADDQSRPILVSHRPAPHLNARQVRLAGLLRERFEQWSFPHLSFWIHRRGSGAADTSQRSRAFLFACIGAAVAAELGISRILLGDNGIVSLNLPFNAQLVGAVASRSTHPKFLHLFNAFIGNLAPEPMTVLNPLGTRTRAEVLEVLKRARCTELLEETNSCSRTRGRPAASPQCGYCSQCVDRRFGSIAAGLEDADLAERYGTDIFINELPEGEARTVAESYVRFARRVHEAGDEELFDLFPQLFDCIVPSAAAPDRVASELTAMLHRHAASVLDVTSRMVTRHSSDLATGTLPSSCLLRMVVGSTEQPPLAGPAEEHVFRQEGQRWTVRFAGQTVISTTARACAISPGSWNTRDGISTHSI